MFSSVRPLRLLQHRTAPHQQFSTLLRTAPAKNALHVFYNTDEYLISKLPIIDRALVNTLSKTYQNYTQNLFWDWFEVKSS